MEKLSKEAQVLKYFLQRTEGLGTTKLMKLAYLADLEARRCLGRPITGFEYVFDKFGPFDKQIYDALDELKEEGLATEEKVRLIDFVEHRVSDTGEPTILDFAPAEQEVLRFLISEYSEAALRDLLDEVVYSSRPMERVSSRGERLPMEEEDNVVREKRGLDLEQILVAEEEAERGNYRELDDFFSELQAEFTGDGSGSDRKLRP